MEALIDSFCDLDMRFIFSKMEYGMNTCNISNYYNLFPSIVIYLVNTSSLHESIQWDYKPIYKKLSEDFIREFQNKVVWAWIFKKQTLSEEFRQEFAHKLNWD